MEGVENESINSERKGLTTQLFSPTARLRFQFPESGTRDSVFQTLLQPLLVKLVQAGASVGIYAKRP